jgi:cob(I)alamin adenosyltransferase
MSETESEIETVEGGDEHARHNSKMAKKKAARDKIMATKTNEKGLIIVHTGKGKGKSTAAFGMIFGTLRTGSRVLSCSSSRAACRPANAI